MRNRRYLSFLVLLFLPVLAHAADASTSLGMGGKLMDAFASTLAGIEAGIRPAALGLFGTLMAIEMGVWTSKKVLHDEFTIETITPQLAWKTMIWGFFGWAMIHSHDVMSSIIRTFFQLSKDSTGLGDLDASGMVGLGINTSLALFNKASIGALDIFDKPLIVLTTVVAMLLLLIAFVVTAAQLVMAQVESMVVIAAAPVLLAFGALSFTREIATNVMRHALSTGVKVLTIYILAGVMVKLGPAMADALKAGGDQVLTSPGNLLEVIGISGLMVLLSFFIPTIASSMLSGSSGLSGTAALGAAMGAAAAAATGSAAAVGGLGSAAKATGSSAAGAVAGATGLAAALNAGLASASDHGLSGLEATGHALGTVAGHGLDMASGTVGSAAVSAREAFGGKVDQSIGGKIASSIQAGRGGSVAGMPSPSTDAGSDIPTAPESTPAPSGGSAPGGASPHHSAATSTHSVQTDEAGPIPSAPSVPPTSGPASASQSKSLAGYVPAGDASSASLAGATEGQKPRSTMGKLSGALNNASELLQNSKEHIIEDRAEVAAAIDHRAFS
ncbi:putative conjugative transfer protein TrbL [Cupriavidus taiwanensis]|uniref:P-type conjugative transfer protein TrbL n=1 Tax=Cupriavidus taiwanensis TaxID=164546 RepID=UPI000E16D196|nr:P-type conjugative transfer protein TrbL [Cupriavidus taiwanensis]SOZ14454.1 putative conjugative transfer protein TrbL [Cupriavidus taiwanensis]SOZ25868.1 putative conjugative transfer protein TrbL [Cupriavidus taiwanensis]SOZ45061.1 putative conjugative transfer protein TrbL [Cupriavidus taiwanensis]